MLLDTSTELLEVVGWSSESVLSQSKVTKSFIRPEFSMGFKFWKLLGDDPTNHAKS
jgi:hypothetical protein